ncbi:MAG: MBL fold metallo-hydrolase [Desulfuromonadales bacterium]|nr:MBL fold metallo-hydrolase [Desulfuromonadales bacterium]
MAKLYYQGHASYRITALDGRVVYVDPYAGGGYEPPADIILITHQHGDHNKIGLIKQNPGCTVITNKQALTDGRYHKFSIDGIKIEAVMAKSLMHNPKKCVGYLILIDGVKIYTSGDTSKTEQMKDFASLGLDYAILCCGGMVTMGLEESAKCAALIGARHNIPVHIRPGKLFDAERAAKWKAPNPLILTPGDEIELEHYDPETTYA